MAAPVSHPEPPRNVNEGQPWGPTGPSRLQPGPGLRGALLRLRGAVTTLAAEGAAYAVAGGGRERPTASTGTSRPRNRAGSERMCCCPLSIEAPLPPYFSMQVWLL